MRLIFSLTIAIITSFSITLAQSGTLEGKVQSPSKQPLENVVIQVLSQATTSNTQGFFKIENLKAGTHQVRFFALGYESVQKSVRIQANQTTQLMVELVEKNNNSVVQIEGNKAASGGNQVLALPGSVYQVSAAVLDKFTFTDINRVLRDVPGVNIQEEDGWGQRPNIGIRGTGSERSSKITLMEDGVLVAPAPYSESAAYYFPSVARMQGVEVRKGASQIRYGPFTTGGAINFTSTEIPQSFKAHADVLYGKYNTRTLHLNAGNSWKYGGFMVETLLNGSDGFKELASKASTGFDKKDFLAKLRLNTSPKAPIYQSLTAKFGFVNEVANETYLGLTETDFAQTPYHRYAGSQQDQLNAEQQQFTLTHSLKTHQTEWTTTAYQQNFKRNWYKLDKVGSTSIAALLLNPTTNMAAFQQLTGAVNSTTPALLVKANNRKYQAKGIQTNVQTQLKTHQFQLGLHYHEDFADRFQWADAYFMQNGNMVLGKAGIGGSDANRIESAAAWSGFALAQFKFGKWQFAPGLRYEDITLSQQNFGTLDATRTGKSLTTRENHTQVWLSGVGIEFEFAPATFAFGGVHKGFAPPNSQAETKPESSINYEIGIRHQKEFLNVHTDFFFNDYANLLGADLTAAGGQGTGDLFNGGEVEVYGVEASLGYDFGALMSLKNRAIPFHVNYTWTKAAFQNTFKSTFEPWGNVAIGYELPYLPPHQLASQLGIETAKWDVNVSTKWTSTMRTQAGKDAILEAQSIPSHAVLDVSGHLVVHKWVRLFVNVQNVTNATYLVARHPAGLRPGMPRLFMGGFKVNV